MGSQEREIPRVIIPIGEGQSRASGAWCRFVSHCWWGRFEKDVCTRVLLRGATHVTSCVTRSEIGREDMSRFNTEGLHGRTMRKDNAETQSLAHFNTFPVPFPVSRRPSFFLFCEFRRAAINRQPGYRAGGDKSAEFVFATSLCGPCFVSVPSLRRLNPRLDR